MSANLTPLAPLPDTGRGEPRLPSPLRGGAGGEVDVLSVGNHCVDILVKPVRRLPPPGGVEFIDEYDFQTGGCGNNAAIAMARLGLSVAALGRLGNDRPGDMVLEDLLANGVLTRYMLRDGGRRTSLSVVAINERGERSFIHHPGAYLDLSPEDVPDEALASARALHVGGAFLLPKLEGEALAGLLRRARAAGLLTFVDTAVDARGNPLEPLQAALPYMDFLLPSETEASGMTGSDDPRQMAARLLAEGVATVCIKLGEQGCYVAGEDVATEAKRQSEALASQRTQRGDIGDCLARQLEPRRDGTVVTIAEMRETGRTGADAPVRPGVAVGREPAGCFVPAFSVPVVDTCGAGDTWTGGFVAGILRGLPPVEAARLANAVGAMCVTGLGATSAVGNWEETVAFMERMPTR